MVEKNIGITENRGIYVFTITEVIKKKFARLPTVVYISAQAE